MNNVYIKKLQLRNFRLYKECSIPFLYNGTYKLNAFVADNGTGKTTILYAINWCLYDSEEQNISGGSRPANQSTDKLPIVNSQMINDVKEGDTVPVEVVLTVVDENRTIEFKRKKIFRKINNVAQSDGPSEFKVTVTENDQYSNTIVYTDEDQTKPRVEQYFSSKIANFYFFDGERLQNFFRKNNTNSVKDSIFNICQIELLKAAMERSESTRKLISRNILNKARPDKNQLVKDRDNLEKSLNDADERFTAYTTELNEVNSRIKALSEELQTYTASDNIRNQIDDYEKRLEVNEEEQNELMKNMQAFIHKYSILLPLYPDFKKAYNIIKDKEVRHKLPPPIDKNLLNEAFSTHVCPVCKNSLDIKSLNYIQQLIARFEVSVDSSNVLSSMKGGLERFINDVNQYSSKRDELLRKYRFLKQQEGELQKGYNQANMRFSQLVSSSQEEEQKRAFNEKEQKSRRRDSLIGLIAEYKANRKFLQQQYDKVSAELEEVEKNIDKYDDAKAEKEVLVRLNKRFTEIHDQIMKEMKDNIKQSTWNYFVKMSPKTNTFDHIDIDDSYSITAYNKDKNRMTNSMSETEYMTLAYAFTLAIHDASGKNCPLVIDSPLGRAAGLNRTQIAKTLIENSRSKQIIILFNPNELYGEVEKLFNEYGITVTTLKISKDETYTEIVR